MTEEIRATIRHQFDRQFVAHEHLCVLTDNLFESNRGKVVFDERPSTQAVSFLYAKARKTAEAVHILASEGYGADATILARSLTNLCIDLGYICHDNRDERALQWMAAGWWARRQMAHDLGITELERAPHDCNTPEGKSLAKRWKGVNISKRADLAELSHFYLVAYRHGSSFEHSDSWSVESFAEVHDDYVDLHLGPSTSDVRSALFMAVFAFYQIVVTCATFYEFTMGTLHQEAMRLLEEAFGPDIAGDQPPPRK